MHLRRVQPDISLKLQLYDHLLRLDVMLDLMYPLLITCLSQNLLLLLLQLFHGYFGRWSRRLLVLLKLGSRMLTEPRVVESSIVQDLVGELLQNSLAVVPQEMIRAKLFEDIVRDALEVRRWQMRPADKANILFPMLIRYLRFILLL